MAKLYLGMGMVLTHDCEMENDHDPDHRHLAPVRPMSDLLPGYQEKCRAGERWDVFPLAAQDERPRMTESFVDFRKLTTVRPAVLKTPAKKVASLSDELRKAVSRAYWNYLHHPYQEPHVFAP